ncbi:MAG TPA: NFACT RNA binding domain-containing protein [Roseiflexaceae bacterium]|nr:NFACT RNA binding domain-containing protein [Roseiflexaceae bacterium]
MYFDALTLAAVVGELQTTLVDGRIQRVLLTSPVSLALEVYAQRRRHHLLLSAHPQYPRVQLTAERPSRGVEGAPALLLLLRKYVVGGRIVAIDQPALERVLVFSIAKGPLQRNPDADEPPEAGDWEDEDPADEVRHSELIVEVMERRGNIVLVGDDNVIMESVRHVTPQMSRRPVRPRDPYEFPPRQNKHDPRQTTPDGMRALVEDAQGKLAAALVAAYRGLSPQVAREAIFRCLGQLDAPVAPDLPWNALAQELRTLWNAPPEPHMALDEEGRPVAFAPYRLTSFPRREPQPGMSAALDAFYAAREVLSGHRQRRDALLAPLDEARERLERQRRQLEGELEQVKALDRLRWEGEMIYAFLHELRPGQTSLEVEGQTIALDPARSHVENAQSRFMAYDKAKSALANVPELLRGVEARLEGLDQLRALLEMADGYEQIEEIGREAVEQGYLRALPGRKSAKGRRLPPLRVDSRDGFTIFVGRSAGQNEQVTFKLAAPDDLWLHARNIPGAHVIIKSGGREVPDATLLEAAGLAAFFSRARNDAAVEIDIAPRKAVRRIPDAPPGLVSYRAQATVRAAPLDPAQRRDPQP